MKYASMKNNKDSNRITRNIRSTYRPLWNVSFAYTHQILLINFMNLKGEKQTDSPLWSSLNLYNIFYDHLDTENIPFPYTGLCDVCEYECEGYIWIWSACQQCVSTKLWNLEIQVHIGHRKIHSTIKHSVHHRHHQSHELSHELSNVMHHHLQNGGGGGGLLWWWWNY